MTSRFIGTAEAATILGCSPATVRRRIEDGLLPTHGKLEGGQGQWLLDRADVERLAQQQETK